MKHIGMDVHRATTDIVVLNGRGQEILHRQIETLGSGLVELIQSICGEKRVVLEECQLADAATRTPRPHVVETIRSQPQSAFIDENDGLALFFNVFLALVKAPASIAEWRLRCVPAPAGWVAGNSTSPATTAARHAGC